MCVLYIIVKTKTNKYYITYFSECILSEITLGNEIGYIVVIYRSPINTASEFDSSLKIFENLLH